jgi:HSP20 family molecular chaperone IbpA
MNKKAQEAEQDASKRIQTAQNRVHQAELQKEQQLANLRDEFQKQYISEEAREEALLEAQHLKGYENLKDLNRKQNENLHNTRTEGEDRLGKLSGYYRDMIYSTEQKGFQDLKDIESKNQLMLETTAKSGTELYNSANDSNTNNLEALTHQFEDRQHEIKQNQERDLNRTRSTGQVARQLAEEKYEDQFIKLKTTHQEQIKNLESNANLQIESIRQETADKLTTYKNRQADPFYKMLNLNAKLFESDDGYMLKLRVPEYEQKDLSVVIKGENLVVMGQRRNEEIINLGRGVIQGTSAYQSYHQSFPLAWPVNANRLSKEMDGDLVIVRVPKKNQFAGKELGKMKPPPSQIRAQFPKSVDQFFLDKQEKGPARTGPVKGSRGSGTLT